MPGEGGTAGAQGGAAAAGSEDADVKKLIARYGSADAALKALGKDNAKYRKKLRGVRDGEHVTVESSELRDQLRDLEEENKDMARRLEGIPPGAVILTGEDAKAWPAFKALNLTPEKVQEAVKQRDELQGQLSARDRDAAISEFAKKNGLNETVLADQVRLRNLHVEMKEVTVTDKDGKTETRKVPHVRPAADDKAALEPITAYIERDLKEYPGLRTQGGSGSGSGTTGGAQGVPYPEQKSGASGGTAGSTIDKHIREQNERAAARPNPLRRPAAGMASTAPAK